MDTGIASERKSTIAYNYRICQASQIFFIKRKIDGPKFTFPKGFCRIFSRVKIDSSERCFLIKGILIFETERFSTSLKP